ncbi:MAG: hypothetical protein ACI8PB_000409 [Desulforhopalus sp.]
MTPLDPFITKEEAQKKLLVEKNGQFKIATILGIQLEGNPVSSVSTGEVGIQIDIPIKKKSKLWKQCIN